MNILNVESIAAGILAVFVLIPTDADAQFLKGIKDKVNQTKEEIIGKKKTGKQSSDKKQSNSTTSSSHSQPEIEEAAKHVKNLHIGTIVDADKIVNTGEQFYSASTPRIEIENGIWSASNYNDGVAFLTTMHQGNFFIDKNGNRLFDTKATAKGDKMPEFENGFVMLELPHQKAEIRDKKGNLIKAFEKVYSASNFRDGIACIILKKYDAKKREVYEVKYVDTKGDFVYPDLWFISDFQPLPPNCHDADDIMISESEGLTPFVVLTDPGDRKNPKRTFKWGYHSKGKIVIEPKFDYPGNFNEGLAVVGDNKSESYSNNYKFGFIDKTGNIVIPMKYSNLPSDFNSGYSKVMDTKNQAYLIDKTGATRLGPINKYSEEEEGKISYVSSFAGGYGLIGEDHEGNDGIWRVYFFLIDKDFNKKAYFWRDNLQGDNRDDYLRFIDGNYYIVTSELHRWYIKQINPETADIIGTLKSAFLKEGVFLDRQSFDAEPGFRDKNGNYTLLILQNQF